MSQEVTFKSGTLRKVAWRKQNLSPIEMEKVMPGTNYSPSKDPEMQRAFRNHRVLLVKGGLSMEEEQRIKSDRRAEGNLEAYMRPRSRSFYQQCLNKKDIAVSS